MDVLGRRGLDITEIFRSAWHAYRRNAAPFVVVAALAGVPQAVLGHRASASFFEGEIPGALDLVGLYLVGPLLFALAVGLVAWAAARDAAGGPPFGAEYPAVLGRRILPLLGTSVLLGLLLIAGTVACIVPGILAMVVMYVAIPATMCESVGPIDAFGRSYELTEGFRWHVFGIVALMWVIDMVLTAPMSFAVGFKGPQVWSTVAISVKSIVVMPYKAAVCGVVYERLRNVKEYTDVDRVAEVFD